ncbi:class I SAM-dependent methyltransferase [Pseudomonas sp. UL073]|uniref:Class I SAM-dependent methyltransferase n=1 Tax=Zestomonas insulae TaxID=2809017 RepID=A0ABS2IA38_9GAMM|nr:class I SAM-dependent methyltransferase [Pseudomonas insulae]MBM7059655.1 class I SAM-dependent methyltransferase [Pseudomonas insulae]
MPPQIQAEAAPEQTGNVLPFRRRQPPEQRPLGNAVLLDYLFGINTAALDAAADGRLQRLFDYAVNSPAARALRCRRRMIARAIDDTCLRVGPQARILCISGGHFREAELSQAIRHGRFAEMRVFDSHAEHLRVVATDYAAQGVSTCTGSLEQLLDGQLPFAGYDLVYSSGLCDHLDDTSCVTLASQLFKATRRGGRLLLGGMRKGIADIGYLEGLLDWRPHYRRDEQLLDLLLGVDYNEIASARVVHDIGHRIAFLEALRYG